jgi:hypothetical protein
LDTSKASVASQAWEESTRRLDRNTASVVHDAAFAADDSDWMDQIPSIQSGSSHHGYMRHGLRTRRPLV